MMRVNDLFVMFFALMKMAIAAVKKGVCVCAMQEGVQRPVVAASILGSFGIRGFRCSR